MCNITAAHETQLLMLWHGQSRWHAVQRSLLLPAVAVTFAVLCGGLLALLALRNERVYFLASRGFTSTSPSGEKQQVNAQPDSASASTRPSWQLIALAHHAPGASTDGNGNGNGSVSTHTDSYVPAAAGVTGAEDAAGSHLQHAADNGTATAPLQLKTSTYLVTAAAAIHGQAMKQCMTPQQLWYAHPVCACCRHICNAQRTEPTLRCRT